MPALKQVILIFEYERPNYLRICLDSLQRCADIDQWPIAISIDGSSCRPAFAPLLDRASLPLTWPNRAGNLQHVLRSLSAVCNSGYERILFFDGDCILRPDALTTVSTPAPPSIFASLTAIEPAPTTAVWFHPMGNLTTSAALAPLLTWAESGAFIGLPHPVTALPLSADEFAYDAVFCAYMLPRQLTTQFSDRSRLGHIGLSGTNHTAATALETAIFSGPPASWLDNAIRLFDPSKHPAFAPYNFRYED